MHWVSGLVADILGNGRRNQINHQVSGDIPQDKISTHEMVVQLWW